MQRRVQALTIIRESGDLDAEILIHVNLGDVCLCLGKYHSAIDYLQQGLRQSRAIGSRWMEGMLQECLTYAYLHVGELEMALESAEGAEHAIRGYYLNALGLAHEALNRVDDAKRIYHDAIAWWQEQAPNSAIAEAYAGLMRLAQAQDDDSQALTWVQRTLPLLTPNLLADAMQPTLVYWSCYEVLQADRDSRAGQVLQTAHQLVIDLASLITDPELRQSFPDIRAHRDIEQAYVEQSVIMSEH